MAAVDELYRCRVCGRFDDESPLWGDDGASPTFEYCPCCGVEAGYQDITPEGARRFRERWLSAGGAWADGAAPQEWDRDAQLARVPERFR